MISPYKIKWLGETSLEMDVWTGLAFDSDDGDTDTRLGREAVISEVYNGTLKRAHGYKWNNDFVPTFTFIKTDYSDFTPTENRKILKWLTKSKNASFLDVYTDDSEVIEYSILGNFVNVSQYKMGNGRIVGYVAEFESLAPYAFSRLITPPRKATGSPFTITIETDEPETPIYPCITIQQNRDTTVVEVDHVMDDTETWLPGTVYHYDRTYYWLDDEGKAVNSYTNPNFDTTSVVITNTHTLDGSTQEVVAQLINNIKGETIVLDGANRVVSSSRSFGRVFGDDFNWTWLPLMEGTNVITVVGNCTITLEWREPMKVGEYC